MTTTTSHQLLRGSFERAGLRGEVSLPGDPGWDAARQAWNLSVDQHPAAVAFPETVADVVSLVRIARETGRGVVTQGTGHGAAAYGPLGGSLLIRTTRMQGMEVRGGRARVGAGSLWGDVAVSAGEIGMAGLGGSSPDVGVVGYTLGGGIGWLARAHGLASNAVRSIGLVDAAGEARRIDAAGDPELFWALRGGGGGLGVVTDIEFHLFPIDVVYAGTLAWEAGHAPALLNAWAEWTASLDDSITSIIRFLNLPPIPAVPEVFRGKRVMTLGVAAVGDHDRASATIDALRRVAPPVLDAMRPMPAAGLSRLHGDPEGPTPGMSHHTLLSALDERAVNRLVEVAGAESQSPLISVEIRHLGGAVGRIPEGAGALSHIPAPYLLNAVGMADGPEQSEGTRRALTEAIDAMSPWSAGSYLNFAERPGDDPFDTGTRRRLDAVKASTDPEGRFLSRAR